MTYVCLLRGVNVGGHSKLPMAEFRCLLAGIGATAVSTYIQSGNAAFEHAESDTGKIAAWVTEALLEEGCSQVGVLVVNLADFAAIVDAQPFPSEHAAEARQLYVGFLLAILRSEMPSSVAPPPNVGADEFALGDGAVYLRCPNGFGRTKLNGAFFERALGAPVTFRNWRTVQALLKMAGE